MVSDRCHVLAPLIAKLVLVAVLSRTVSETSCAVMLADALALSSAGELPDMEPALVTDTVLVKAPATRALAR